MREIKEKKGVRGEYRGECERCRRWETKEWLGRGQKNKEGGEENGKGREKK